MNIRLGLIAAMLVVFCLTQYSCALAYVFPKAKLTVRVLDEQANPIENAEAGIGFFVGRDDDPYNSVRGVSNRDGEFTGSARSFNQAGFSIRKDGYYTSYGHYRFKNEKLGRWQPWNPTVELVLRKIENPVPMYARNTRWSGMEIPVVGEPVGFDLTAYDWVAPHGNGEHADFIFKLERRVTSWDDYDSTLTLAFSNPLDGIQLYKDDRKYGSDFKLPRFAPETGYKKELVLNRKMIPGDQFTPAKFRANFEEDDNYFFRIRSEEKDGKLLRAMYGKIQGEMRYDPRDTETAVIHFKYYLNPDYTRNMEYDPKQNLFKDLPSLERVRLK